MTQRRIPHRGDVYWIDPNPTMGREMKDRHRFVTITPKEINRLGVAMFVPITGGGGLPRETGLTVTIMGYDTTGVAVCNQVRTFDIEKRVQTKTARYIETLDEEIMEQIINRVLSVIDPAT